MPTGVGPGAGGGGAARPNSSQATSSMQRECRRRRSRPCWPTGRRRMRTISDIALDRVNPLMNVHGHASTSGTEPAVDADIGDDAGRVIRRKAGGEQAAHVAQPDFGPEPGGEREPAQAFEPLVGERAGDGDPEQLAQQAVDQGVGVGAARSFGARHVDHRPFGPPERVIVVGRAHRRGLLGPTRFPAPAGDSHKPCRSPFVGQAHAPLSGRKRPRRR